MTNHIALYKELYNKNKKFVSHPIINHLPRGVRNNPNEEVYIGFGTYIKIPAKTGNVYFNNHSETKKYFNKLSINYTENKLKSMIVIRDPIKRWFSSYIFCMQHRYAGLSYNDIEPVYINKFINRQYSIWKNKPNFPWWIDAHFIDIWRDSQVNNHWNYITDTINLTKTLKELFPAINWRPHTINDNKAVIKYNVNNYREILSEVAYDQLSEIYAKDVKYYNSYLDASRKLNQTFVSSKDLEI
tara:strand:- start:516 stop:1244 length:729 start_codon:yes stop_codon:yes gene_type:complete